MSKKKINEHLAIKDQDDYIETLVVNGHMVNVFINDYGQCFWFQWLNDKGELESMNCGTSATNYKEQIEDYFKPEAERMWESLQNLKYKIHDLEREMNKLKGNKNEN